MGYKSCPQKHKTGMKSQLCFHYLEPYQDLVQLTPPLLSAYQPVCHWHLSSPTVDPMECHFSNIGQHPYLPHPCIFSHNSPPTTNYGSNPKSDLSGLLHTIIQTSHIPTIDSTSHHSWTLDQVTNLFICPWSAPFVWVQHTRWNSEGCLLKLGKRRFWGLSPIIDFSLRNPFAELLSCRKTRAMVRK